MPPAQTKLLAKGPAQGLAKTKTQTSTTKQTSRQTPVRRLSPQDRKQEIMQAAGDVFIAKGFSNTTMEDVIAKTTLSKGGVYHYYKNTLDILRDIMLAGTRYRSRYILDHLDDPNFPTSDPCVFWSKMLALKSLEHNYFMPLYVQLLIEKQRNSELEDLFLYLKNDMKHELMQFADYTPEEFFDPQTFDTITIFMNAFIVGATMLGGREDLEAHKSLIEDLFAALLQRKGSSHADL